MHLFGLYCRLFYLKCVLQNTLIQLRFLFIPVYIPIVKMPRGGQGGGGRGGSSRGGSSRGGGARGGARGGGGPMNRGRGGGFGRGGIGGARGGGWSRPEMNSGPINKMVFWRYQGCEQILGPFKIEANELLNIRNKVFHCFPYNLFELA